MAMDPLMEAYLRRMMTQDDGRNALQQQVDAYDALGPEGYKQIVDSNTLAPRAQLARQNAVDQSSALERQLAMAQALATPKHQNYGTVGGNIAGGLGDALGAFFGGLQAKKLGQQQADILAQGNQQQLGLLDKMDAAHLMGGNAQMNGYRNWLNRQQPQAPAPMGAAAAPGAPVAQGPGSPPARHMDLSPMTFDIPANAPVQMPEMTFNLRKGPFLPKQDQYAFNNFQLPTFGG